MTQTTKPTILEAAEKMNGALLACIDEERFLSVGTVEKIREALKIWHGLKYGKIQTTQVPEEVHNLNSTQGYPNGGPTVKIKGGGKNMTATPVTTELFDGLKAIIQYRRKDWLHGWIPMMAFDVVDLAHKEAQECSERVRPWVYRVAEITDDGIIYHPEIEQPFIKEKIDAV